jgi:DNA primase small subunit
MGRREFAFVVEDSFGGKPFYVRHKSFSTFKDLITEINNLSPLSIYYSSAYYDHPDNRNMKEKGWMAADLVFDIDADHILDGTYEAQIEAARIHNVRLVEILLKDFGLVPDQIIFTGGRGFHTHIRNEKILHLDSSARREIASYITCREVTLDMVIELKRVYIANFPREFYQIKPISIGMKGRLREQFQQWIQGIIQNPSRLDDLGYSEKKKVFILNHITENQFDKGKIIEHFLNLIFERVKDSIHCEIDAPVTSDVKRLIRLPWSIHGKTLRVAMPVDLETFNLVDHLPLGLVNKQVGST